MNSSEANLQGGMTRSCQGGLQTAITETGAIVTQYIMAIYSKYQIGFSAKH